MNAWRWLGVAVFLVATVFVMTAVELPVSAGGDKTKTDKTDKAKTGEDKEKKKVEEKKPDPVVQPVGKGDLTFKAFDTKDKVFYQKQYTKTTQKMKVMGQEVTQEQEQTFIIEWTPKSKDADGTVVVAQRIVGVEMTINIGGNKIAYKSHEEKQLKNPMTEFFDQLKKNPLTFTIKKDLTISKIDDREKFVKELGTINPQMTSLLNAILSDKALTKMAEPTWYAFPTGGAIPPSKKWDRTSELDLGPIGKYSTKFDFTYLSLDGKKDKIKIDTKLTYTAPTEKAGLPFIIHEAKLTADTGKGEAIFDRELGRFESTEITMNLKGTLKIEVGNTKTDVDIDQEQKSTSTTLSELQAPWKK